MSLYQEVRPEKLEGLVGNLETVGALKKMLRKPADSRPHSFLLKGPSGCGKTTIARILAKEFGSNDTSTFEINAADVRGIDAIREIRVTVPLIGLGGASKTYILDEAHKITGDGQTALLKILEDTPLHCYCILCTTEPERVIETVRNRCAEYLVRLLIKSELEELLTKVCEKKDFDVSSDVKEAIALTCAGSPRAALVSLEQVKIIDDDDEALEVLVRGTKKDATVLDLLKLLTMYPEQRRRRWKQLITTFDAIEAPSETIRMAIMTFLFNKLKKQESIEEVLDITHLLKIFSTNTFYGKKAQLGALVARSCFETWKDD